MENQFTLYFFQKLCNVILIVSELKGNKTTEIIMEETKWLLTKL